MGKYGVVIGVNYVKNPEAALQGCCNDARLMVDLLKSKGFEDENIKLLIDDDDSYDSPNHVNIKNALSWLCADRSSGDVIFMHFSGHGTQVPSDEDDYEADSLDEAICLEELFLMADDDLKQFFSQLPEGVKATVVMDCCHSGSMLDGTEVVIEGAKDADSAAPQEESASLLSALGGSREASVNRSLPISTICDVMSSKLGQPVEPTGAGVNGAMAKIFGGNAGKLMMKFALSQLKKDGGGSSNPLIGMLGGMLGGSGTTTTTSTSSNPLGSLLGGGSTTTSSSNPLGSLLGGGNSSGSSNPLGSLLGGGNSSGSSNPLGSLMGGSSTTTASSSNPLGSLLGGGNSSGSSNPLGSLMGGGTQTTSTTTTTQTQNPMSMLTGMLGGLGLEGEQSSSSAPSYNPEHQAMGKDVCTLITGCQASETSADVRPKDGGAYGALTKTLTTIHEQNPDCSYYDLVSNVRTELSKGGFKQNPCLECSESTARDVFIC